MAIHNRNTAVQHGHSVVRLLLYYSAVHYSQYRTATVQHNYYYTTVHYSTSSTVQPIQYSHIRVQLRLYYSTASTLHPLQHSHAIAPVLPCYCHVLAMLYRVIAMLLPRECPRIAMILRCTCHVLQLSCHVIATFLP